MSQTPGVILKPLADNRVFIRTADGKEEQYEVRLLVQQRLAKLSKGDSVVLLVDDEDKVTDLAVSPSPGVSNQR